MFEGEDGGEAKRRRRLKCRSGGEERVDGRRGRGEVVREEEFNRIEEGGVH